MRAVVQRVLEAKVVVDGEIAAQIKNGLLVYLSIGKGDDIKDAQYISDKLANLRIFSDKEGKMNLNVREADGGILLVSNFTLHGDCRKGRRPGFDNAAEPKLAQQLYEKVVELTNQQGLEVDRGIFGAHMLINSVNDGPVTFLLES